MEIPFQKPASTDRSSRYWISSCLCSEQSREKLKLFFWGGIKIVQCGFFDYSCPSFLHILLYSANSTAYSRICRNTEHWYFACYKCCQCIYAYVCTDHNLELKLHARLLYHWIYLISHYKWRVILPLKVMLLAVFFGMKLNPICGRKFERADIVKAELPSMLCLLWPLCTCQP